jgi:hypothetical protein
MFNEFCCDEKSEDKEAKNEGSNDAKGDGSFSISIRSNISGVFGFIFIFDDSCLLLRKRNYQL